MNLKRTGWILLLGVSLAVIGTRIPTWRAYAQSTQGDESNDGAQKKQREVELRFWQDVDKTSVEELKLYLQKYPNGEFSDLARAKLAKLRRHQEQEERSNTQRDTTKESAPGKTSSEPQIVEEHAGLPTFTGEASARLEGTVWEGAEWQEGSTARVQFHVEFKAGGMLLTYASGDASAIDNSGTWEQNANSFTVRFPIGSFKMEGTVAGNRLEGGGHYTKRWVFGQGFYNTRAIWRWDLTRVPRWEADQQRQVRERSEQERQKAASVGTVCVTPKGVSCGLIQQAQKGALCTCPSSNGAGLGVVF